MDAEDPPTPRMYRAIIPTAAPGQLQNQVSAPHSPKSAPEAAQVVLHQGLYDQDLQHASPKRHAHHTGQEQAMEDLRHTVRHVLTGFMSCGNSLQQQQGWSSLPCLVHCAFDIGPQLLLLVLDCPVKCLLLHQLPDDDKTDSQPCKVFVYMSASTTLCCRKNDKKMGVCIRSVVLQGKRQRDRLAAV